MQHECRRSTSPRESSALPLSSSTSLAGWMPSRLTPGQSAVTRALRKSNFQTAGILPRKSAQSERRAEERNNNLTAVRMPGEREVHLPLPRRRLHEIGRVADNSLYR